MVNIMRQYTDLIKFRRFHGFAENKTSMMTRDMMMIRGTMRVIVEAMTIFNNRRLLSKFVIF